MKKNTAAKRKKQITLIFFILMALFIALGSCMPMIPYDIARDNALDGLDGNSSLDDNSSLDNNSSSY